MTESDANQQRRTLLSRSYSRGRILDRLSLIVEITRKATEGNKMSNQQVPGQYLPYIRQIWRSTLPTIVVVAVLPVLIYVLASPHMAAIPALFLASIPAITYTLFGLAHHRRLNLIGVLSLLGIAVKLVSLFVFKDAKLVLASDSLMMGVYGMLMLASLPFGKPLLLVIARNALANAPVEQRELREHQWSVSERPFFTVITAIWGIGLLVEMLVAVILVYTLTVTQFLLVRPVMHYVFYGVLILVSYLYAKMHRKNRLPGKAQQA